MASPDVVVPALLLPIPLLSIALALYNYLLHRSTPAKGAALLLLAIFAAVAGGTALSVACGQPLKVVAKVFTNLLHASLSAVSIYALGPSSPAHAFPLPFLGFLLSLAALLVACELVSALIPTSPPLLPALFALVARSILLTLATVTTVFLRRQRVAVSPEVEVEKGSAPSESSGKTPGRVSSPTQATWPFPGSLASQDELTRATCTQNTSTPPPNLLPALTFTSTRNVDGCTTRMDRQMFDFLPLVLTIAQIFATLSAALSVATNIVLNATINHVDRSVQQTVFASAACTLLWSFMVLATIQLLPAAPHPHTSEKQVTTTHEQGPLGSNLGRDNPVTRKPKPSLSRRESDSLLDFLSLRDPFASSPPPPPPPPLPPVGLGLDEVDVGWSGNKEISMQYRFPAPRSIVKGRRKGKMTCGNGNRRLMHQDSARTLLPVPETRSPEADVVGDRDFGDEARLAQLLLQSLSEGGEDCDGPNESTSMPMLRSPQVAHVQQSSRWSTSTTVQSIMSASISNRSGVSTYTTCASDKVPTSRISMNTIASALGSRKSSEARRKSAATAASSKG